MVNFYYIWLLTVLFLCNSENKKIVKPYNLLNTTLIQANDFQCKVGSQCIMELPKNSDSKCYDIVLSNGISSIILSATSNDDNCLFKLPEEYINEVGIINWKVIDSDLKGVINVKPVDSVFKIEAYLGPPSLMAGEQNKAALSSIVLDRWGNLVKDSTLISMHEFQSGVSKSFDLKTEMGIGIYEIASGSQSGKKILSVGAQNISTKAHEMIIHPSLAAELNIKTELIHNYADGHQTMTVYTDVIYDSYGNKISDGSLVEVLIEDEDQNILKASATSVNGVASAAIIHPSEEKLWKIKGRIPGIIESSIVEVKFENAFSDFEIDYDSENKLLNIGPVRSFLNQFAPNGTEVSIELFQQNKLVEAIKTQLISGKTNIDFKSSLLPKGDYEVHVEISNIRKTLNSITL